MSQRGATERFQLPNVLITSLNSLSRAYGVTLYMTLLAAFKVLLFRYGGQEDIVVGAVTDARRRPELEGLMGYFLDTLALRTYPSASKTFSEYLVEVRGTVLDAMAACAVPFDHVVKAVQPKRTGSHHPIFQVFFSIEPPAEPFPPGWDLTQMEVPVASAKFDLYLELDQRPDHMAARFMYNTDIFDQSTIVRMAGHWRTLLEAIVHQPGCRLDMLPFMTREELAQLTGPGSWNDTARSFPQRTLPELLRLQAKQTPNSLAAIHGDTSWTYTDLLSRSRSIAARLQAAGVRRGSIVAILMDRSLEMVAGMIAVLITGSAYLPLDPDAPAARIALCLEDASPVAILTDSLLRSKIPATSAQVLLVEPLLKDRTPGHHPSTIRNRTTSRT